MANSFYSEEELREIGFLEVGTDVFLSRKTQIYSAQKISIGSHVRIDDNCILAGAINIGRNVHIAPGVQLAAGGGKIFLADFSGIAFNTVVTASSDDYSGRSLTNATIPSEYKKNKVVEDIYIGRHAIVGASSVILPGSRLNDGVAVGALSLVRGVLEEWKIFSGNPLRYIKDRDRAMLQLEQDYLRRKA